MPVSAAAEMRRDMCPSYELHAHFWPWKKATSKCLWCASDDDSPMLEVAEMVSGHRDKADCSTSKRACKSRSVAGSRDPDRGTWRLCATRDAARQWFASQGSMDGEPRICCRFFQFFSKLRRACPAENREYRLVKTGEEQYG